MNSNLFVKPLNTLHAQTFTGIEALMYQGENFLVALATGIAKIRENKKFDTASIKEGRLNEIATKFTGMNVTIAVERGFGAYMYMPPMDNSHPFQNNYLVTCPLFAASGEVVLKGKGDPIAEIDYTTAKVGGVYSMIPVNIFIGTDFFISEFTNEEIAAIILHELGHAWTYFLYLGRMYFANFLISSYANEIIGTKDVERRKILIKAAEKRLGIEIYNPNALAEQPSITKENVEILFINSHRYTLANTTGTDIYDFRSCEQLADYFATMHGAGPHLVSGLNRLYEMCGSEALIPGWLYTILEIRKLILLPILIPAWLGILLVCNPAMKRYDDPKARAKYVELQLKGVLKNKNLAPEVKRSLLDGIEAIGKDVDRLTDHQGIEHMFWTVLSPSYRRGVKQEQSQKVIESIIFNDLYQKAAIFDSMEELNPHLDEAAIVVAESRKDLHEADIDVNFIEVDSDIDQLNKYQEDIIENGEVTEEQLISIESICLKYKIKPTLSVEEYRIQKNVVSQEALGGLALAGIGAAVAIIIAIAWKIINWIKSKDTTKESVSETANKIAEENNKLQNVVDTASAASATAAKDMVKNIKANNPGITISEIDNNVRASYFAATNGNSKPVNTATTTTTTAKPLSSPTPVNKPSELFVYSPAQLNALGRVIDDEFMRTNVSFKGLFKAHCALDSSLVKKYGKNGFTNVDELDDYLTFYFKQKPSKHIEDYLKGNEVPSIHSALAYLDNNSYKTRLSNISKQGANIPAIVDLLLKAFNKDVFTKFEVIKNDDGVNRFKNREKLTAGNYLGIYLDSIKGQLASLIFDNDEKAFINRDVEGFANVFKIINSSDAPVPISKTKLFKDPKSLRLQGDIDTVVCVDKVAIKLKEVESLKENFYVELNDYLNKFDEELHENNIKRNTVRNLKVMDAYYADIINLIVNYEKTIASFITMNYVVKNHLNKIKKFYVASSVTLIEYMNTPG